MLTGTAGPLATAQNVLWFASAGPQIFSVPLTVMKMRDPSGTMPAAASAGQIDSNVRNGIVSFQRTAEQKQKRFMSDLQVNRTDIRRVTVKGRPRRRKRAQSMRERPA